MCIIYMDSKKLYLIAVKGRIVVIETKEEVKNVEKFSRYKATLE